jgi:acyl-CoA hydrolase
MAVIHDLSSTSQTSSPRLVPADIALIQHRLRMIMAMSRGWRGHRQPPRKASRVIAESLRMPDPWNSFIHIEDVSFVIPHDEPILEYTSEADTEIAQQIGKYVSRLIRDGETIQVGYGSIPNSILSNLRDKKHLGVHSELLTDGMVTLIKDRVIDNTRKTINRGKTVAAFCMGKKETSISMTTRPSNSGRSL